MNRKGVTIRKLIAQYLEEYEKIRPLGKTKSATLKAIKDTWLGELDDSALSSQKRVEFAQWRMSKEGGGVQAQTVRNDLSHLGGGAVHARSPGKPSALPPPARPSTCADRGKPLGRLADFMRRCKGKVMVSINDHPDIRQVFECFHFETLEIRYTTTNQRQGKADVISVLIIMNWEPEALGGLFIGRNHPEMGVSLGYPQWLVGAESRPAAGAEFGTLCRGLGRSHDAYHGRRLYGGNRRLIADKAEFLK